jgi:hypothetical protein
MADRRLPPPRSIVEGPGESSSSATRPASAVLCPDPSFRDRYWRSTISGKCKQNSRAAFRRPTIGVRYSVTERC